jgi:hypothetical protein
MAGHRKVYRVYMEPEGVPQAILQEARSPSSRLWVEVVGDLSFVLHTSGALHDVLVDCITCCNVSFTAHC